MKQVKQPLQKITVHVPKYLLEAALKATHKNITDTVKEGLKKISTEEAFNHLKNMRGKISFENFDLEDSRRDK